VKRLHITNGTSVCLPVPGDVIYWNDVLHEGPVPAGLDLEQLSRVRAEFLGGVDDEFRSRDAAIARAGEYDEVVLWFEHDLYDQLQLIQVLDWFAQHPPRQLRLIQSDTYLGPMGLEQLEALYPTRKPVTPEQFDAAVRAWAAFRAPDPTGLQALDTSALPHLGSALLRHLEQFPSTRDGLSRTEKQILEAVANGASTKHEIFLAHQRREDAIFMGDSPCFDYIDRLATARTPLLNHNGRYALTDAGRAVLAGEADAVRLNGIDRWLGGVHLSGPEAAWRWDPAVRSLQKKGTA